MELRDQGTVSVLKVLRRQCFLTFAMSGAVGYMSAFAVAMQSVAPFAHPGRADAALTALFTPSGLPPGTYQAFVTAEHVDALAARYRASFPGRRGAWRVITAPPLEILGSAAPYDRGKVARLYGARPIRVARGSIREAGRVAQSVSLIAPYPDATLTKLLPGTLVLVFNIPPELRIED